MLHHFHISPHSLFESFTILKQHRYLLSDNLLFLILWFMRCVFDRWCLDIIYPSILSVIFCIFFAIVSHFLFLLYFIVVLSHSWFSYFKQISWWCISNLNSIYFFLLLLALLQYLPFHFLQYLDISIFTLSRSSISTFIFFDS